jgi:hypothetical protein
MDPHLVNIETGTFLEPGIYYSLSDLTIYQIEIYLQSVSCTPGTNPEILSWPISLN